MSAALDAARKALQENGAERLSPIEKAQRAPKSLRAAITAKCWDCVGQDADPHPRWRIANCECETCPLWNVRPWRHLYGTATPVSLEVTP